MLFNVFNNIIGIIGGERMNSEISKKQNKKVIIFAIILSVLSIGLLIFGFMLVSSDKVVMLQSISNLSNKFNYMFEEDHSLLDKLSTAKDIGIKSKLNLTTNDMNASLSFDYLENKEDQKSSLTLDTLLNEQALLNANLVASDNNAYFFLDNITPHYYHTPFEYVSFMSGLSSKDYDKIFALLKETVTDYIDNSDIQKEKVKVLYHGKQKKVNKLTYTITTKTVKEIATKLIDNIKEDTTLLNNISSYLKQSKEETIQNFDEFLKSLDYDQESSLFEYHVYYYGFNQIFAYELQEVESKITLEYKIDEKEMIQISCGGFVFFSLEVSKNKNQYDFNGYIQSFGLDKYPFTGYVTSDTMKLLVSFDENDFQIMIHSSKQERDNNYLYQNNITVSSMQGDQETQLISLDIDVEYYFNQKVNMSLDNSTPISEITDEELAVIQNNIQNHPIYELFQILLENPEFSL